MKQKSKRTLIFTLISVFSIIAVIALNFVFAYFGRTKTIFLDMTAEGLYTVTDAMRKECSFVGELEDESGEPGVIKITFCNDPDRLISQRLTRLIYFMSLRLRDLYPENIKVETVNATLNPTALQDYKTTSLSVIEPTDVIVSYGDRYRIVSANKFWFKNGNEYFSYNGEYRMASLFKSVTAINNPTAYFLTDHGETYYDPEDPTSDMSISMAAFADLLAERGLNIGTLEISKIDAIPEDCALLIINAPTEDFRRDPSSYGSLSYVSDTEKIDRYLVKRQGAVMVAKDFRVDLPVLETFLREWGFSFGDKLVKDDSSSLYGEDEAELIFSQYNSDKESYGYAIYGDFADVSSSPKTVFSNAGSLHCSFRESYAVQEQGAANTSKQYASFLTSAGTSKLYGWIPETGGYDGYTGKSGSFDLAAVTTRSYLDPKTDETVYSYLFCTNTKDFFSEELLGNPSYANYDVTASLVENMSRLDAYASSDLGGQSLNSSSFGGKQLYSEKLYSVPTNVYNGDGSLKCVTAGISGADIALFSVIIFAFPVAALVVGIVINVRRKFL